MVQEIQNCIDTNSFVIVKFYRPSCPYCKYVRPIYEAVTDKYSGSVTFLAVDISDDSDVFKDAFSFSTVPTFIYFKDGRAMQSHGSKNRALTQNDVETIIQNLYI